MSRPDELTPNTSHLQDVRELGCIICGAPANAHHPTSLRGDTKAPDELAIPLCPDHHQHGGQGIAIHAGIKTFEMVHDTNEVWLLALTIKRLTQKLKRSK